jgi:hypothetical protein
MPSAQLAGAPSSPRSPRSLSLPSSNSASPGSGNINAQSAGTTAIGAHSVNSSPKRTAHTHTPINLFGATPTTGAGSVAGGHGPHANIPHAHLHGHPNVHSHPSSISPRSMTTSPINRSISATVHSLRQKLPLILRIIALDDNPHVAEEGLDEEKLLLGY